MNVSELLDLAHWISEEIEGAQIIQKYQALQTILQLNSQPNQQQPFESLKIDLVETLKKVPIGRLTLAQIAFLHQLGIDEFVGEDGVNIIEDILYKNVIDVATSAQKIQEIIQKMSEGVNKFKQIKSGLTGCVTEEEYEVDNEILMRISFTGHAVMANVKDFKTWGNIWYDIGRGVAMAHDAAPEDIKIVGATKGSIILELAVAVSIATTTSGIILAALKVAEKIMDIRMKAEELRGLKLKNDQLAKDLEKEADNEKKLGIEEITARISEKLAFKDAEGDKVKALDTAVKNLVNFIEKGGVVDFIIPEDELETEGPEEDDVQKKQELRVAFQQIRQLEKKLALLVYKEAEN